MRNKDKKREYDKKYRREHSQQQREKGLRYYQHHKDTLLLQTRVVGRQIKTEVLTHYGKGKLACVVCGFDDIRALTIDHIDGSGGQRRKIEDTGVRFYKWLKGHNYPLGYQTLCFNHNQIKKDENNEYTNRPSSTTRATDDIQPTLI